MQLGQWIKAYRKEQGLSMQRFADLCGFSKAYIGQLEKGINPKTGKKISPTMQTFTKIANSVGMSVDQLLEKLDDDQPVSIPRSTAPAAAPAGPSLSARDERDIERRLQAIRDDIDSRSGLALMEGQEMTDDDRAAMLEAIENGIRTAKRLAKKYTNKRYLKDKK